MWSYYVAHSMAACRRRTCRGGTVPVVCTCSDDWWTINFYGGAHRPDTCRETLAPRRDCRRTAGPGRPGGAVGVRDDDDPVHACSYSIDLAARAVERKCTGRPAGMHLHAASRSVSGVCLGRRWRQRRRAWPSATTISGAHAACTEHAAVAQAHESWRERALMTRPAVLPSIGLLCPSELVP